MIKNVVFKGITLFLLELRKHLQAKTAGKFWNEISGRVALPIHYTFKDVEHKTLHDFVNWFIDNHNDVSDEEFTKLLNEFPQIYWILEKQCFFMLEVVEAQEVEETLPTLSETYLQTLDVAQLRELCDNRGVKYFPAAKQKKLIELLLAE